MERRLLAKATDLPLEVVPVLDSFGQEVELWIHSFDVYQTRLLISIRHAFRNHINVYIDYTRVGVDYTKMLQISTHSKIITSIKLLTV